MEYANNHQIYLRELAGTHKRNAEQAQEELEILTKQSGTDKKTLAEAQKRVKELNSAAHASAQAYNNNIAELKKLHDQQLKELIAARAADKKKFDAESKRIADA